MSEDSARPDLQKALALLPRMKKHLRDKIRRRHRSQVVTYKKYPRQICDICNKLFDEAICPASTMPKITRCKECVDLLAQGYTAFRTVSGGWAFLKSKALKPELAGAIRTVTDDQLEQLQKAMKKDPS